MLDRLRHIGFVLALVALSTLLGQPTAQATIVDQPQFKIDGLVILWGVSDQNTGKAQISRKMTVAPAPAPAPYGAQVPVTGHLSPLGGGELTALTDTQMHFFVASNTAFSMDAEMVDTASFSDAQLAGTRFDLSASLDDSAEFGQSAQYPHDGGPLGGMQQDITTLADLTSRRRVFTGNRPTAARPGTITEQSVRFDITLGHSDVATRALTPEIVFTVFVP